MSLTRIKFETTRKELSNSLIERDQEIDLALTALVAQEHVLFVGPPGTAKSMLADSIVSWIGGDKFHILINKFTTPEEIFGPISVSGLKADKYRRITTGKLPEAQVAFIDEIFKASSAILNTTLQVLNERVYRNDDAVIKCPLKLCVAASNEWPGDQESGGKELNALFDRFLFRKTVKPIGSDRGIDKLLWTAINPKLSTSLSEKELTEATTEAAAMPFGDDAKDAVRKILKEAKAEGIQPGDRRLRKSVRAAQAFAWLNGEAEVTPESLEVLSHVLWDDPSEQPKKMAEIVGKVANPSGMKINSLLGEAAQITSGANLSDLSQAATATKKLSGILKEMEKVKGLKAEMACAHITAEIKKIKAATIAAI